MDIKDRTGQFFNIPVLHYVQLLGLALGLPPEKLGLYNNVVSAEPVVKKILVP
jgi:heterodisulfide reductase subunit B